MEKYSKNLKIISQRGIASKSNDLPLFVQLMIQKDRANLKRKCTLEAEQLMAIGDKVYVSKLPNEVGMQLLHPYEDSNPPKIKNFEIVSNNVSQEQKIKSSKGLKQLQEILS